MTDVNSSCSPRENSGINRKRGRIENALPSSQRNKKRQSVDLPQLPQELGPYIRSDEGGNLRWN